MLTRKNLTLLVPVLFGGCAAGFDRAPFRSPDAAVEAPGRADPYDRETGLYAAARAGDAARVRLLLAAHPTLLNDPERYTKRPLTLLQIAADQNRLAVMQFLIEWGANLEAGTPLRIAARNGHREAAELLLKSGATLDVYSAVALDKRVEVERMLRVAAVFGAGTWAANVRCAVFSDEVPVVRVAADKGHAGMVELLLRYGADPDAKVIEHPNFISDNNFKGVTVGLTPAGTFAPDLDVPVRKP